MTVDEFKAWLDGYAENVKGAPTVAQWKRIQEKLGEVYQTDPTWIPTPFYVEPWRPTTQPYWYVEMTPSSAGNSTTFTNEANGYLS